MDVTPFEAFGDWPRYVTMDEASPVWIERRCYGDKLMRSLARLEDNLKTLASADDDRCRTAARKFANMYAVTHEIGELRASEDFQRRVADWLRHREELVKKVDHQFVLYVYNEYTREHAVFSPLRANRPQVAPAVSPLEYSKKIIMESAKQCDFCAYSKQTSEDVFGRIKTNRSVSAANTFKVGRWHSMIIPLKHSVLELDAEDVIDMYQAGERWLNLVHTLEPAYKYPWLMWDIMPHAGASQIHPHVHVGLTTSYYVGIYENMRRGAESYHRRYGANLFQDIVQVHVALGLAVVLGEATAIAQLTSRKDTEITIVSHRPNKDFYRCIYYTYKAFMKMGFYDFSSLTVFPIMGSSGTEGSLPAVVRISSRGNVADIKSEISSFELYQFANLNVDPYEVIRHLNRSVHEGKS